MNTSLFSRATQIRILGTVILISGFSTMALQMAMMRLISPELGSSSIVWATVIGSSLLAMSFGYDLGGRLVSRSPDYRLLVRVLFIVAVLTAGIPLLASPILTVVLRFLGQGAFSEVFATFFVYLILGFVPATLLGVSAPFIIQLATIDVARAGKLVGSFYAISTVGSIVGTLLTSLVLVQWIGTRWTFFSISILILCGGVILSTYRTDSEFEKSEQSLPLALETVPKLPATIALIIVVIEGMTMMATEMSIARLVAPFFGASHAVWAIIIAIVMGSIAIGAYVGGKIIDHRPRAQTLSWILIMSAVCTALLPFAAVPVMRLSTGGIDAVAVGTVVSSFFATMLILTIPVVLLGMVPPAVVRLAVSGKNSVGRTAGYLYSASTAGAIVGTFASVLVLIPSLGTRRTLVFFGLALCVAAVALVWYEKRGMRAVGSYWTLSTGLLSLSVISAGLFFPIGWLKPLQDGMVIAEKESRYQFIQVVQDKNERRLLQLNEGWAVHSIWDPNTPLTGGIWDHFLALPSLAIPDCDASSNCTGFPNQVSNEGHSRLLLIGSAAGTAARAMREIRPEVKVTNVELDPEVTRMGRRYFDLRGAVVEADGRPYLRHSNERWNVIHVDAYRQPYIPFHLTTREFFRLAKSRLKPKGIVSINVGSTPRDHRINDAIAATMGSVFEFVIRYRAERYNELIIGSIDPNLTLEEARKRLRLGAEMFERQALALENDSPRLKLRSSPLTSTFPNDPKTLARVARIFEDFGDGLTQSNPQPNIVLTDDRAPVEWMTDRMIFGEVR